MLRDDFCGGGSSTSTGVLGETGWFMSLIGTSGLTNAFVNGTLPNLCQLQGTTSATSGRGGTYYFGGAGPAALGALGSSTKDWEAKFTFASNATSSTSLYIGMGAASGSLNTANFMGLRLDTAASSPGADSAFSFVVCKASTCTRHGTTYTADTSFHTVDLKWTASTSTLAFQLDANSSICFNSGGTGGCTASSNIPTVALGPVFQLVQQSGSAQVLNADFFAFTMTGLSR